MNTSNNVRQQICSLIEQESNLVEQLDEAHQRLHLNIKLGNKYLSNEEVERTWGQMQTVEHQLGKVRTDLKPLRRVDPIFNPEAASYEQLLDLMSEDLTDAFTADSRAISLATA